MELDNPQLNRQGGRSSLPGQHCRDPQDMDAEGELAGSLTAFTFCEIACGTTAPDRGTRATILS
jgi:hypothetical protein